MTATRTLTVTEVAALTGRAATSIMRRKGVERYIEGEAPTSGPGRPATLLNVEVLRLWNLDPAVVLGPALPQARPTRKLRNDRGRPRAVSPEVFYAAVHRTRSLFMSAARQNLVSACREAARQLSLEGVEIKWRQIHRRLSDPRVDRGTGNYISEYWHENWPLLHESAWKKKDVALSTATLRYDWISIMESLGWAAPASADAPGRGAGMIWAIDGRSADTWVRTGDGSRVSAKLPSALYIRCALTGMILWVEPIESESSAAVKRALMKCMVHWRMAPMAIATDGGVAVGSRDSVGLMESILPPEAWEMASRHPEIFPSGRPFITNIPNIPRAMFKASLERSFKLMKDEFDCTRFPWGYQGGSRDEAVQLTLRAAPVIGEKVPMIDDFFAQLRAWLWGGMIDRERPDAFPSLVQRGVQPTIRTAWEMYGGPSVENAGRAEEGNRLPCDEGIALALYWLHRGDKPKSMSMVTVDGNTINARINNERWPVVVDGMDYGMHGERVAVLPFPGSQRFALVFHLVRKSELHPRFIGVGMRTWVSDVAHMVETRRATNRANSNWRNQLREARTAIEPATWGVGEAAPTLEEMSAAAMLDDGTPLVVEIAPPHNDAQEPDTDVDPLSFDDTLLD